MMGVAVGLVLSAAALADDAVMASRFGNTTISTYANGDQSRIYYRADHTFTVKTQGKILKGTWKIAGMKLCRTLEAAPAGTPPKTCVPVEVRKVGDTWTVGDGADRRTVTLVKGVQ
jgi:hypothetical protein